MKKALSLFLALILLTCLTPSTLAADGSLGNFTVKRAYDNRFTDVSPNDWFYQSVKLGYESGMINGATATSYAPGRSVTIAEVLTLAANLHSIFTTGQSSFVQSDPWHQVYVDYAEANGFPLFDLEPYDRPASRGEVAAILSKVLPSRALSPINTVDDNAIPDVKTDDPYAAAIYTLYRAGILSGSDNKGAFHPNNTIKRSEIATIVSRMAYPSSRTSIALSNKAAKELTPEQIAAKCSDAVFMIEVYEKEGAASYVVGSGFFLTSDGLAVTCLHVIEGGIIANVITNDGKKYPVEGIYSVSKIDDLAIIQVTGMDFKTLELGPRPSTGDAVYAIGSPNGKLNIFSQGKVTYPLMIITDTDSGATIDSIECTTPVDFGSSGGALLNRYGQVVGVTFGINLFNGRCLAKSVQKLSQMERIAVKSFFSFLTYAYKIAG